jgi:hypothetical protein
MLGMLFFVLFPFDAPFALEGTLRDFRIPLLDESFENRGNIHGASARFINPHTLEIHKADASYFIPEMSRTWRFLTESCFFDKNRNQIFTERHAVIKSKGIHIDGRGLEWRFDEGILTIASDVTVDIDKNFRTVPRDPS